MIEDCYMLGDRRLLYALVIEYCYMLGDRRLLYALVIEDCYMLGDRRLLYALLVSITRTLLVQRYFIQLSATLHSPLLYFTFLT